MVPKKFRLFFVALLFLGVFFTMSRSNIMIFLIIVSLLLLQRKVHFVQFFMIFITVVSFLVWLSVAGFDFLEDKFDLEVTEDMKNRVEFFVDNKSSDIQDTDERQEVLASALNMYMSNPIFGSGYASTRLWDYQVSPHNTFVMHWADYGLFGVLLMPLMFLFASLSIFRFGTSSQKKLALSVILYFILSSFFSHNMLEQPLQIASMVMLSVIGYKAKKRFYEEAYLRSTKGFQ